MKFKNLIVSNLFSFNAVAIMIGIVGSLASVSALVVNINSKISVGWLLMVIFIFATIVIVLLKILFDIIAIGEEHAQIRPIQVLFEKGIIVLKTENHLEHNQILTVFYLHNNVEILAAHGFIQNIQKGGIATLKINKVYESTVNFNLLENLIIKTIVPMEVLVGG